MKWFSFEELMPPQGMHIIVLSYKDEVNIIKWDKKFTQWPNDVLVYSNDHCMGRTIEQLTFWAPVEYLDLPKENPDDGDELAPESNMLHGMTDEQSAVVEKIRQQSNDYNKLSEEELSEWIKVPYGMGGRKGHLIAEVAKLFRALLYGSPEVIPFEEMPRESFDPDMLKVNHQPKMMNDFSNLRKSLPATSGRTMKLQRYKMKGDNMGQIAPKMNDLLKSCEKITDAWKLFGKEVEKDTCARMTERQHEEFKKNFAGMKAAYDKLVKLMNEHEPKER